jgi:uncharacterized protein with FMN-binding domain
MKKILLSAGVLGVFLLYALHLRAKNSEVGTIGTSSVPQGGMMSGGMGMMQNYKDGSYVGSVADAFYGNVQVRVAVSGGKISDVVFLQYPNDRETSIMINQQAMPLLKQEAIQIQSAQVSGVSGATQTSRAFIESLQSALNQAI